MFLLPASFPIKCIGFFFVLFSLENLLIIFRSLGSPWLFFPPHKFLCFPFFSQNSCKFAVWHDDGFAIFLAFIPYPVPLSWLLSLENCYQFYKLTVLSKTPLSEMLPPFPCVPIWSGIELIFILEDGMVLCFEVRMRVILITAIFICCWAVLALSQTFFCISCCPASKKLGVHKELGRGAARTADPKWPKGSLIPSGVLWNN